VSDVLFHRCMIDMEHCGSAAFCCILQYRSSVISDRLVMLMVG